MEAILYGFLAAAGISGAFVSCVLLGDAFARWCTRT